MNLKLLSVKVFFLFLIFGINDLHSQVIGNVNMREVPNTDFTIRGDFIMVGNAISGLSRIPGTTTPRNPNLPYNGTSNNNGNSFGYIDIDSDPSTFSSSSAVVNTGGVCSRVVYAGLYWTATYYTRKQTDNDAVYSGLPVTDNRAIEDGLPGNFRDVKFKPPGSTDYIDISVSDGVFTGTSGVLFDGWRNTATNSSNIAVKDVPYVCYAEVTDLIPDLDAADGEYFVGNIRSTIGPSRNGVSGGWVLVMIYEDTTLPTKLLSSRFGFKQIGGGGSPDVEFLYDDFRTLPAPNPVNARYGLSTLEGDFSIVGDQLQLFSDPNPVAIGWRSMFALPENTSTNFFNSTISIDGNHNLNRTPASQNTLGLEIDVFDIPNFGNELIGNDQTSARFRTTTSGDSYSVFVNAFSIEVIEPKLTVTKRVLDITGTDITGDPVNFGDQLFYELTIENNGNEDITAASIRDLLPDNVDFTVGTITTSNPGIVATPDPTSRQIDITITDDLVVRGGGLHTVRFGVRVVATCADLRDACSNQINNIAISTYTGVDSGITRTGEESILELDACRFDIEGSSNVLINDGICFTESIPSFFCTGSLVLTAGDGFANYTWTYVDDPSVTFPNTQSITVTLPGTYTVLETGAPGCLDSQLTFVVDSFTTVTNPIIDVVAGLGSNPVVNGNIRTCPITGESLPEIFLCGAGTTLDIPLSFAAGTTVVWERLDPSACPTVTRDSDCPTPIIDSGACDGEWVEVSTDVSGYTLTEAGEYRIRATFDRGCTVPFYFNAFKNNFKPNLIVIREIICGTPGTLRVNNSSIQYEYQLITPSGATTTYQNSPEFAGLTEIGNYTVNARQRGGLPTACVFQDTEFLDELDANEVVTVTSPTCPDGRGEISITVTDSKINYTYTINSTTTAFTDSEGPTTTPSHTFIGLVPDTYEVQVLSADGSCSETFTRVVTPAAAFSATVRLVSDLKCNPAYQPDITLPDFDDDLFIAIYEVTVTGGSGSFEFNDRMDFLGTVLEPLTGTTYQFRATAAGNYPVYVGDLVGGCIISAGSVDVTPYEAITATATPINPDCSGSLGAIDVTITAGLAEGPFTYILDEGTGTEVRIGPNFNTTERFNSVDPTVSHTVTVEDQFGCNFVVTPDVTFTFPAGITATINDDFRLLSCTATPGAQAQVTAITGGSGTYEWSLSPTSGFVAVAALPFEVDFAAAGSYTIYIRNQVTPPTDSCVESFPIVIDPLLEVDSVTITPGDQDCSSQTVDVVLSASPFPLPGAAFYEFEVTPDPASGAAGTGSVAFNVATNYTFTNGVSYTVRARRSDTQCINTGNFTGVAIPEIQITSATQDKPVNCVGASDGILSFTVGNSASYTYTVTGPTVVAPGAGAGVTPVTIGSLSAGTYTITVTDTSLSAPSVNCSTSTTVDITEPLVALSFTPVVDDADCGNPTGTITVNAVGGRGGYEYELRNAAGTLPAITAYQSSNVFSGLAPATYTVFVRDDSDPLLACEVSQPVIVPVTVVPSIALATGGDACYTPADPATQWIAITLGVPAPVGPFTYSLDGGGPLAVAFLPGPAPANTFEIPNLAPGAHTVTVTNTGSTCSSNTVNFTINPELTIIANLTKDLDCSATPDATITFTATGGDTTYTFDVLGPDAQTGVTSPASVNTAGTYQIRVTDGLGCIATSADIIVNPTVTPTATTATVPVLCFGESTGAVTITPTAGEGPFEARMILPLPAGVFGPDLTFTGLAAGNYVFEIRDSKECVSANIPVTITESPEITATIDAITNIDCSTITTGTIELNPATGGSVGVTDYTYVLLDGVESPPLSGIFIAGTQNTRTTTNPQNLLVGVGPTFDLLDPGTYFIDIIASDGCSNRIGPFVVTQPPFDLNFDVTPVPTDCSSGATYQITVTGGEGPFLINEFRTTPPISTIPPYEALNGELGGVPAPLPNAFLNETRHEFTGLDYGTPYVFEIIDTASGCRYFEAVPVVDPPGFDVVIDSTDPADCFGDTNGTVTFTVTTLATTVDWEVFDADTGLTTGITGTLTSPTFTDTAGGLGEGNYFVRVVETAGAAIPCTDAAPFTITQPASPLTLAFVSATPTDCNTALSTVTMDANGGVGPYEFAAVAGTLPQPDPIAFPLTNTFTLDPTTSTAWVIFVRDANNCIVPREITIPPFTPAPVIDTIDAFVDDACTFDNAYTFTVTATSNVPIPPGTGALTFSLDGGARVAGTATGPNTATIDFPLSGPGTYSVVAFDENGCPSLPRTIEVFPELQVTAVFTDPTCRANDATIVATVTGGSAIPANWTFDLVNPGTGVTIPGVTQTAGPLANQLTFSSTTPGTDGIFPGDYRVEVTDSAINVAPGCTDTFDITVPTFVDPIPSAGVTPVSCFGGDDGSILISLDPSADDDTPYTYELFVYDPSPIAAGASVAGPQASPLFNNTIAPITAGQYEVVVTSSRGCPVTLEPITILGPTAALNVVSAQTAYACNATNDDVFPVITLTISGGTAPYDVAFTGPSSSGSETDVTDADLVAADVQYNITASVAGTYSITVTDENNCVFTTFDVIVPPFAIMTDPTITRDTSAVNNGVISCTNPETVIVSITGGTGPFTFTALSGTGILPAPPIVVAAGTLDDVGTPEIETRAIFTLPSVGNYVFQILDQTTTCTIDTAPYPIAQFDTIDAAITLGNDITCFNTTPPDGSVNLTVTNYTGTYDYVATNSSTVPVTTVSGGGNTATDPATGLVIPGLAAGDITVVVTATQTPFCDATSNVVAITQPPAILVTANQIRDESCTPGDDALIEVVARGGKGTLEYQLEDAGGGILVAFGSDPRFGGFALDGGVAPVGIDYVVRVRDATGCEQTDSINIQPPVPLGLNPITAITLDCADSEDGVIVAVATGGQGVGTYFFSLTFPDGSVSAAVNNGTNTFQWSDLKPGNYIVTVSDNLACEAIQNPVVIDAPPAVTVDVTPTGISCLTANPNNILVTGGGGVPGGYTYGYVFTDATTGVVSPIVWQPGDTFAGLPEGDYDFYVRDGNLCESPASTRIQVRNPDPFVVTLDTSNFSIVCFSEATGSVDAVTTGGLGSYGYRVNGTDYLGNPVNLPGPTPTDTQTTSFFGDLLAGTYTYTVTSGDCVDKVLPFEITQPLEFLINNDTTPISCNGETDGSIRVFVEVITPPGTTGGTPPYFFSLYNSAGDAVFTFIEDDSELPLGEHTFIDLPADTYRVEVEDNNGCPKEILDIIIVEPDPILATVDSTTPEECVGDMNGTATISITGGLPPVDPADPSYFWSIDGVTYLPVADPTALLIDNLPGGTTTVFIRDSRNNPDCQGAFNIEIEPGVNLDATLEPRLVCPIFDYTDPMNPVITNEEQYFIDFNIIVESEGLDIIYTLNGINGTPNPPSNTNLTGTFEVAPGEYEGIMESSLCVRTIGTIEIIEYIPLAIPFAEMTNNPKDPNEYRILASGGRQFENDPFYAFSFTILEEGVTLSELEPSDFTELDGNIFAIRETADYVLRVVDADGCEVLVVQNLTYINIRIPNYFTPDDPNSSIEERFWYPRQITPNTDDPFFFENIEVTIFDRFGRVLAEFKGDQKGWTGQYQGKQLPSGDYWYTIILNDVDNREFTGHFTLYR